MPSTYALTIDFWDTMVVSRTNGERRQSQRMNRLQDVGRRHGLANHGVPSDQDGIQQAYQDASERFYQRWKNDHVTPRTTDLVHDIWNQLELTISDEEHAETVRIFEEGLLYGPPDQAEGLPEALAWAAQHFRLGIISDTMFSPGRVIKSLLAERNVLQYFDSFVFSDEQGFSKPSPEAFESAARQLDQPADRLIHIGDLRRTDVQGARNVGAVSIRYAGIRRQPDEGPAPDHVLSDWRALPDLLADYIS